MNDSSEHDGQRFHNPKWLTEGKTFTDEERPADPQPPPPDRSRLLSILRWRLGGTRVAWPVGIVDPAPPGDPWEEPAAGEATVTFIGHSSFLIRLPGLTVLTDPVFSDRASPVSWAGPRRARRPGRMLQDLPPVDLVLLSHNHYDHLDLPSLRALHARSSPGMVKPLVITPLGNAVHVRKAGAFEIRELDWWQETVITNPVPATITAVPARHFSSRTPRDDGHSLWAGFMLQAAGIRLLFGGDSGDGQHWRRIRERLGAPDLAFLPIGAYAPRSLMRRVHMDPAEAVHAHTTLGAARSIGMHFGTFQLTDEAIDAPEQALDQEKHRQGVAEDRFVTLGFGECRRFTLSDQGRDGTTVPDMG